MNCPVIIADLFTKVNTAMIINGSGNKAVRRKYKTSGWVLLFTPSVSLRQSAEKEMTVVL